MLFSITHDCTNMCILNESCCTHPRMTIIPAFGIFPTKLLWTCSAQSPFPMRIFCCMQSMLFSFCVAGIFSVACYVWQDLDVSGPSNVEFGQHTAPPPTEIPLPHTLATHPYKYIVKTRAEGTREDCISDSGA